MKRREFIILVVGAAARPFTARAQQPQPTIGVLLAAGREPFASQFYDGLREL
jgi:hypothetical protein